MEEAEEYPDFDELEDWGEESEEECETKHAPLLARQDSIQTMTASEIEA